MVTTLQSIPVQLPQTNKKSFLELLSVIIDTLHQHNRSQLK